MDQKPMVRISGIVGVLIAVGVLAVLVYKRTPRADQAVPVPSATPLLTFSVTPTSSPTPSPTPTPAPTGTPAVTLDDNTFFVAVDGDDGNPGSYDRPWATLNHAAETLHAGQTVYVRGGVYLLECQVQFKNAGQAGAWITYAAYPGEQPVFDARAVQIGPPQNYPHDKGTLNIEGVAYIRVIGLTVRNSYQMGITVRDSHHVEIINNYTDTTFGPGIGVWDSNADGQGTEQIQVLGNTVTHANTWDMLPEGYKKEGEPPHEAISIAGAQHFEVAYNYLYDTDKEGIDIKEVSKHGVVHHNYIRGADRQGLYIDAWFGAIEDIEVYENVVHRCRMSGMILSVENGKAVSDVHIHHNLFFDNLGTGFFFSRWGDGPRTDIQIYNNVIYHNGIGAPGSGARYYWMTGGLYLFSNNLEGIDIRNNIIAENAAFQIGYSDHWLQIDPDIERAFALRRIVIDYNLIYQTEKVEYPLYLGWGPDMYANVWSFTGINALEAAPLFVNPLKGDLRLRNDSPAIDAGDPDLAYNDPDGSRADLGAFPAGTSPDCWWQGEFPPVIAITDD
ncbi:MAG: right-handed parallel beta-helix repeat-containing protein [Anaerolineae bacterium]|nr:right-handed parallel beta-helix repeat-containing protein [Anaerolineae bacterium]